MGIPMIEKIFYTLFFMATLVVVRQLVDILRRLKGDGYKEKYEVSRTELILLWLSLSYLLSSIFTGII